MNLTSFGSDINVCVVGATGGIGTALINSFSSSLAVSKIYALSRHKPKYCCPKTIWKNLNIELEDSIEDAKEYIFSKLHRLNIVIVATGLLHDGDALKPEKTWKALSSASLEKSFAVNTIGPALVGKHFLPLMVSDRKSVFAALSARISSVQDNRAGGWHSYRASKAALNMIIKNFAIELAQKKNQTICVGLHPGTVNTSLSSPFQKNIEPSKLFDPSQAATFLINVINNLRHQDSGNLFAWDGNQVQT